MMLRWKQCSLLTIILLYDLLTAYAQHGGYRQSSPGCYDKPEIGLRCADPYVIRIEEVVYGQYTVDTQCAHLCCQGSGNCVLSLDRKSVTSSDALFHDVTDSCDERKDCRLTYEGFEWDKCGYMDYMTVRYGCQLPSKIDTTTVKSSFENITMLYDVLDRPTIRTSAGDSVVEVGENNRNFEFTQDQLSLTTEAIRGNIISSSNSRNSSDSNISNISTNSNNSSSGNGGRTNNYMIGNRNTNNVSNRSSSIDDSIMNADWRFSDSDESNDNAFTDKLTHHNRSANISLSNDDYNGQSERYDDNNNMLNKDKLNKTNVEKGYYNYENDFVRPINNAGNDYNYENDDDRINDANDIAYNKFTTANYEGNTLDWRNSITLENLEKGSEGHEFDGIRNHFSNKTDILGNSSGPNFNESMTASGEQYEYDEECWFGFNKQVIMLIIVGIAAILLVTITISVTVACYISRKRSVNSKLSNEVKDLKRDNKVLLERVEEFEAQSRLDSLIVYGIPAESYADLASGPTSSATRKEVEKKRGQR